ncbi:MAG TPA: molybdenum ABC transporter ATP-binding protein [Polyangiales bacterium]|nr:molybdenum ABC transporter ATP-binding protein [Polyangiales bacterium]
MTLQANFRVTRPAFSLEVELTLPAAGITGVIGPSGAGKTTLLRCIAGLERAIGTLRFRDEVWQDDARFVAVHRRPIGYVVQEASLFPHLTVRQNLEFGERRVKLALRRIPFAQAVDLLGIERLLPRDPQTLSGGERQRVAIARAILTSPSLLLMDEPLASLDLESRAQILPYFDALERELRIPIVYVTHTLSEVARLAARVVWLEAGRVRMLGPINRVLTEVDLPIAHLEDAGAVLDASVIEHAPEFHLTYVSVAGGRLAVSARPLLPGARTRVLVRARDVSLSLAPSSHSSIMNVLEYRVLDVHADRDPAHRLVRLERDGVRLLARVTYRSTVELGITAGLPVFAQVKSVALVE